ncbi:MAG: VirB4 family type IV secretion system protein [Mycobacteriales bacterium]
MRRPTIRNPRRAVDANQVGLGLLGPDHLHVHSTYLAVGGGVCRSFAVTGYPREVGPGWLAPLLEHPARLEVSVHVEPVPTPLAADRLRRQLARLESTRRADTAKGRLADPQIEVATDDAHDLATRLARGDGRLFRVGLYLTVHASNVQALDAECARLRALTASVLLDAKPVTFRSLAGWVTTLPVGLDQLRMHRTLDTDALAAAFPFTSTNLTTHPSSEAGDSGGVLYGVTAAGAGIVRWDRFAQDNHNSVILARSGAGKSYLAKLEALRSLYTGVHVAVVDPEDEYARLAAAVGGSYLHLGSPGVRLNPFDLAPGPDALTRRCLFLHTLIAVLLGGPLDPATAAALDRALLAAYAAVGITADPRTHARPAPLLTDLSATLAADADPAGRELGLRLAPYVTGSHRGLFDGPTSTRPAGHLLVFSLRDLPEELKTVGTLLTLDAVWHQITNPNDRRRRLVIVDEAWLLMRDPAGAKFLYRMAKSARKHWAGLTVVTQDAADLLGCDLGQAVVANAATQILLRQAPQTIDTLTDAFGLSDGERGFLLTARQGEGLLAAGTDRVAFHALASPAEHALVTTNPAELADLTDTEPDL